MKCIELYMAIKKEIPDGRLLLEITQDMYVYIWWPPGAKTSNAVEISVSAFDTQRVYDLSVAAVNYLRPEKPVAFKPRLTGCYLIDSPHAKPT